MSYQESYQEPYTKYPNQYNDVIKPLLTDTQRDICDVVIRMTYGWHQTSAAISNTMFKAKTGKSEPAIIRAKKSLEEMGVLVILQEGGGSQTSEYMLDLYYDNPDKSIKASLLQQQELIEETSPSEPQDDIEAPAVHEYPQPEMDDMDSEVVLDSEVDESYVDDEELTLDSNVDDCQAEMSDPVDAENLGNAEGTDTPYEDLAPLIKNSNNIYIYKNKQRANTEDEEKKTERKEAAASVCSLFRSWGIELEAKDYAFVGWCFKEYGLEAVNGKIQIMKFQRNRGVKFSNPLGWLRSALTKDFGYSKWDSEVMKAKERARIGTERLRLEQEQRENEIQEMEKLRNEAEEVRNKLTPEDREDLRKKAIEQISGMGIASNWINEPLIKSIENEILCEGGTR